MKFTVNSHRQHIDFLDLHIFKNDDTLKHQNLFQKYRPKWLHSNLKWKMTIPKGQFTRIKRNCTMHQDYIEQTDVLIQRFRDKGYLYDHLLEVRDLVGNANRDTLLATKKENVQACDVPFFTGFNKQF